MKEKTLLKIAFTCSLIGLFLVFIFSNFYQTEESNISEIKINDVEYGKITGIVERIIETNTTKIIEISKKETIALIVFDEEPLKINEGDFIEAKGSIELYKGEKEIIADEIRLFKE